MDASWRIFPHYFHYLSKKERMLQFQTNNPVYGIINIFRYRLVHDIYSEDPPQLLVRRCQHDKMLAIH